MTTSDGSSSSTERPFSFDERLREIDQFFLGTDRVHQTMHRAAEAFERAGIPYAVIGGMAVKAHGHLQTTGDVDFLVAEEGLTHLAETVGPAGFERVQGRYRRFLDRNMGITFDIVISGMYPRGDRSGPIAFPH